MMPRPLHVDKLLAQRLESLCAAELERFVATAKVVDPASGAAVLQVAGGVAAWVERGLTVNQALGLGFSERVTTDHITELERFYSKRGQSGLIGVCPLCRPSLTVALAARRWVTIGFENVLVLPLDGREESIPRPRPAEKTAVTITEAITTEERELWAQVAAAGFSAPQAPGAEQLVLARMVVRRPGTRLYLAWVDGVVAGTGELYMSGDTAWLSGDATLPQFRRRGVQWTLQCKRLQVAAESGAVLAVSEADPGGGSQRNMERLGFRVAYTRSQMAAPSR